MHRRDKRKTAQPTPLSIISRHPAVPPLLRCTRLPAVPSPFGRARNPAVPPLFERNPIVPLCRPVQKQPAALQYRPVGRQLAALTCRPCTDTSSSPYYIVSVRISSTAPPHRSQTTPLPPIPLFGYSPVPPRCATPFGCAPHCPVMLLLTGSTRCPAYRNRPAVPSLFEYSPLLFHAAWLKGNSAAPPPFGHDAVFHAVRPAPDAPYCTAMPPMRGNTLVTRPYPLFKSNPVARCPSLAGDLPRRPAVPDLFPVPNDPNGSFFFFCQAGFSMEVHRNGAFLFSNGQR